MTLFLPAQAGMHPQLSVHIGRPRHFPRTSGDTPMLQWQQEKEMLLSLHAQGCT
ncbi:hypothetical protein GGP76_003201 [Salinibacter ruber]|nr:hypothetical protein [Salinibacter ruber]